MPEALLIWELPRLRVKSFIVLAFPMLRWFHKSRNVLSVVISRSSSVLRFISCFILGFASFAFPEDIYTCTFHDMVLVVDGECSFRAGDPCGTVARIATR